MKHLIKQILKETIDNRIVDVLIKLKLTNVKEIEEFLKETGYDENEIKEIYSSYFETITGSDLTPMNWMNYYFSPDQLEIVKPVDNPNSVLYGSIFFKKDGKVVMEQSIIAKTFWFDSIGIWSFFKSFLGMEFHQIDDGLTYWLENTLRLDGYRPMWLNRYKHTSWVILSN